MPNMDLDSMSPEERAEAAESAQAFLRALESRNKTARDNEDVWIMTPSGRPELCKRKLWRTHLSRKSEQGYRLMDPEEVQAMQDKIESARKRDAKKQKLWARLPVRERVNPNITGSPPDPAAWQEYSMDELEEMVEAHGRPTKRTSKQAA